MLVYGVSVWDASKPPGYDKRKRKPLQSLELTPEALARLKKRIPRWKPDADWTYTPMPDVVRTMGRKPTMLDNADLVELFDGVLFGLKESTLPSAFEDIFHGVARADLGGNTRPLSVNTIYRLLSKLDRLSTDIISDALGLSARQARKYMQACGLIQLLIRREVVQRGLYNRELIEQHDRETVVLLEEARIDE